ncbi:hypothetical protein IE53DRAFT_374837 [Violaceomyces palustris]|uniref:Uncharacterized protein n=1 Tax=Violaceomyces palustris TaxID=1673888 RepID=A0ACD0NW48_9BASI|nr:hypothetical protein IE53DRAFT_374837 [Violaceomyces palustris]
MASIEPTSASTVIQPNGHGDSQVFRKSALTTAAEGSVERCKSDSDQEVAASEAVQESNKDVPYLPGSFDSDSTKASGSNQTDTEAAAQASTSTEESASTSTPAPPARRPIYKIKSRSKPKGILKPAPPPQKGFSFRRDILQNLNTRLAQQGVNMQVPVPQAGTAQAATSYIGGMFRKIGGIAAGAAGVASSGTGIGSGFLQSVGGASGSGGGNAESAYHQGQEGLMTKQGSTSSAQSDTTSIASSATSAVAGSVAMSSTLSNPTASAAPLKKVQFQVSLMNITYPIVGSGTPQDEDLTRLRIEKEHRQMLRARKDKTWTPEELEMLYRECCRTREEHPLKRMRLVFQEAAQASPPGLRTMDLSFVPLDRHAIEPIADLLSVDFGLSKLILENCALTDDSAKSILHALLVSGTLPNLSLASNRKIRFNGWRYIAIFMRRARALRYLDLSENSINKPALEHIVQAISKPPHLVTVAPRMEKAGSSSTMNGKKTDKSTTVDNQEDDADYDEEGEPLMPTAPLLRDVSEEEEPPSSALISLRLENCGLKTASLEMLAQAVRFSDLRHLSLRRNRINQLGTVALAVMLKDYPDSYTGTADGVGAMPTIPSRSATSPNPSGSGVAYAVRSANAQQASLNETSTRQPRSAEIGSDSGLRRSYSPILPDVPLIISSPGGGVTSRKMPKFADGQLPDRRGSNGQVFGSPVGPMSPGSEMDLKLTDNERRAATSGAAPDLTEEEAIAIYQAKRAKRILADLPRVGNLLTLDLKSNDIRGGVVYLAQVLKKNRTLRVLNLSDNNIEMPGLVAIAEALKYNSTLETLDMSHNPCSGPGLEGITTLRTAFTLNSNLKRLFLNDTDLSSEGAIALAEFLPEAKSLIHLDLAENFDIDIAGVMALAVSVKMNKSLRCLDLNIPPNDPDFARLSQEILQSCIRNTEAAQLKATQRGLKQPVAAPIYKSVVARAAREKDERQKAVQAARAAEEQAALAQASGRRAGAEDLLSAAAECRNVLKDLLKGEEKRRKENPDQKVDPAATRDFVDDLTTQSKSLKARLGELAATMEDEVILERALSLHDELEEVSSRLENFYRSSSSNGGVGHKNPQNSSQQQTAGGMLNPPVIDSALSSPTFSIGDSDDEDSEEEEKEESSRARGSSTNPTKSPLDKFPTASSLTDAISSKKERRKSLEASSSSSPAKSWRKKATSNLSIDTDLGKGEEDEETVEEEDEELVAEKEVPEDQDEGDPRGGKSSKPPKSPVEDKAKGQLSEEGELFRKAKSLGIDSGEFLNEDEEGGRGGGDGEGTQGEGASAVTRAEAWTGSPSMEKGSTSAPSQRSSSSSSTHSIVSSTSSTSSTSSPSSFSAVKNLKNDNTSGEEKTGEELEDLSGEQLRKDLLGKDVPDRRRSSPKGKSLHLGWTAETDSPSDNPEALPGQSSV